MSTIAAENHRKFRHLWSHQLWIHRIAVRCFNLLMSCVPFRIKYGIGKWLRLREYPYRLLDSDSVVVQVGAPADTLSAGRSRAMYFCLFTKGGEGKTVIVEPDQASEHRFGELASQFGLTHLVYCPVGAWSEQKQLKLYVDRSHPATNFIAGTVDYDEVRMQDFDEFSVPVDTVDNILATNGILHVDLISITTNGSERQILSGMRNVIDAGLKYICLARTEEDFSELMASYGFQLCSYDDRGFTFQRSPAVAADLPNKSSAA